jgi:L-ascorbate metabolism protein UlaG (beta-lactamase superfamily)
VEIKYLGHAAVQIGDDDTTLLVDPFLTGNPTAAASLEDVRPDLILLTHGHGDHFGDTVEIAKRSGAPVLAIVELARELAEAGLQTYDPNLGGTVRFDWGWVKLVPAWHTSTTPSGTVSLAVGLLIDFKGTVVYHAGDTCLFSDMKLVGRRGNRIDVALVPIGGHYTMDRIDAVTAVEYIAPRVVIPIHYDTFPPIKTDARAFKSDVESHTGAECVVLAPGETHSPGAA